MDGGIGFRDLTALYLALLAKQGWRLMTNPSSLASLVQPALIFEKGLGLLREIQQVYAKRNVPSYSNKLMWSQVLLRQAYFLT